MNIVDTVNFKNLDIVTTVISVVSAVLLGFFVFRNNPKSITNQTFFSFSVIGIIYALLNYISYHVASPAIAIWVLRLVILSALWYSFFIFKLFYVFPQSNISFPRIFKFGLVPITVCISILILTPFVFREITEFYSNGGPSKITNGPGIVLFGLLVTGLVFGGLFILFRKMTRASGVERIQLKYVLIGSILSFSLLIIFNFIFPAVLDDARFIPLAPIFFFPFIVFTTLAIMKHHLLGMRVVTTEFFTVLMLIVTLIDVLLSSSIAEFIPRLVVFILVSIFGVLLIKGTFREIRELQLLSQAKSDFVSIVSHQLRTPLTAIKGFVSLILESSGTEEERKDWLKKIFISNERLIRLVSDILNVSRIEEGKIKYEFKLVDIIALINGVIAEVLFSAKDKGLTLLWQAPDRAIPKINADEIKLRQVILNLLDNAIHYTNKGWVSVHLTYYRDLKKATIVIQDTGIGMYKDDLVNLFGRFSRGKESQKSNTEGMGIGLYVAKHIIAAHRGRIWAESEGPGTGSKFYVELPVL